MKSKQTFFVITQSSLSSDEWKVLGLLYQPLMGVTSFSLYHTLYHLLNQKNYQSEVFTHQFLLDLLVEKPTKLKEALDRLEALNLVETYQDQEHFIYQLKAPLTPRGFLKDTVMGQFLLSELGSKMFSQVTQVFKVEKLNLDGYERKTKNFDDVFSFVSDDTYIDSDMYLGKKNNTGAKINHSFDYEAFVELLPHRVKKHTTRDQTREEVEKIVFVYRLTVEQMVEVYKQTAQPNGDIDLKQLAFKAKTLYLSNKTEEPIVTDKKVVNEQDELLSYLKTTSPLFIIEKYATNDYQYMAGDTAMQLVNRNQVEKGIINSVLLHVLLVKEGILPNITYLEKVLETWLQNGITTTEDAYEFIMQNQTVTNNKNNSKSSDRKSPDWVMDYLDELNNRKED